jgi:hypothetical protein
MNAPMEFFKKMPFTFDIGPLRSALAAHPELWDQYSVRKTAPATPHGDMSDIWVRYNDIEPFRESGNYSTFNDRHVPVWYDAWTKYPDVQAALREIIFDLMASVEGEMLGGVLITRIPSGGGIAPHTDHGWHVEYYDKFYVSIESAPGAEFWCGDEFINPDPGEVYLFDNKLEHWVTNGSDHDRMTLIVCIRTDMFRNPS